MDTDKGPVRDKTMLQFTMDDIDARALLHTLIEAEPGDEFRNRKRDQLVAALLLDLWTQDDMPNA